MCACACVRVTQSQSFRQSQLSLHAEQTGLSLPSPQLNNAYVVTFSLQTPLLCLVETLPCVSSTQFIIEDMKQQQTNKHSNLHREDQHITVEELWKGWKTSEGTAGSQHPVAPTVIPTPRLSSAFISGCADRPFFFINHTHSFLLVAYYCESLHPDRLCGSGRKLKSNNLRLFFKCG